MTNFPKTASIYVAGRHTLLGLALHRQLERQGFRNVVSDGDPDFGDRSQVEAFFQRHCPEFVFVAAGKSGGIHANQQYPATLMLDNLQVVCNLLNVAYRSGVQKLLYLASSCSYPKHCPQPMQVTSLLSGALEPTNEAYAIAKLAGIRLCQAYRQEHGANFIAAIPANPFGIGDDFSLENSHVIPALLRRMHEAKLARREFVEIWGTGTPRREFLFADDIADACIFLMEQYNSTEPINIAGGTDISIRDLAETIRTVVGYPGKLRFDASKPDGMPFKALDASTLQQLGWQPGITFEAAIHSTYQYFLQTITQEAPVRV